MSLESLDFQSLIHQQISNLIGGWQAEGFSEEEYQECANQLFQMGVIASQQVVKEGGIQPQGSEQTIPYTPKTAERTIELFVQGMNAAIMKAHEQRLPSEEKWALMQNVAYHVFEQAKQAVIATLGQEQTPDVQISDEQIINWLGQTAIEALLYYINEHEKQHGPIARTDMPVMPDLLSQPEEVVEESTPVADYREPPEAEQPIQAPTPLQPQAVPEIHHKYAAVGLFVSTLPVQKQAGILAAFNAEEQNIIQQYRDPEVIAQKLDLGLVAKYLRSFKDKMGQGKEGSKSRYASALSEVITKLPPQRLEHLFQNERPLVRVYISQFTQSAPRDLDPYSLPAGVEESLILYLQRNFPNEVTV